MTRQLLFGLSLLLLTIFATPTQAQSLPAVEMPPTAYLTLNLDAGQPLDPFIVSLNGGGPVAANTLVGGCVGYIPEAPTLTVNWSGESEFVEVFFYSEHDPVLVVETPDGIFHCVDDANELLLDPVVQVNNPPPGAYKIWVGSFDEGQLLPGILVLTTRPEINLGTFDLDNLVRREPIAEDLIETESGDPPLSPSAALTRTTGIMRTEPPTYTHVSLTPAHLPLTTTVTVSGTTPTFEYRSENETCNGLIEQLPSLVFDWEDDSEMLNIFFAGSLDATLFIETPDGTILCNDDSLRDAVTNDDLAEEVNLNPIITISDPPPGHYYVYVGRLEAEGVVEGVLTVTDSATAEPPVLGDQPMLEDLDEEE
jgi:hypothetical protein